MIPLRFVGEKMGGTVKYVNDKSPIVLKYGDRMVELRLNSKIITVYQANKGGMTTKYWKETIDVAAQKKNGKTYIPLRAISQALGFKVHYESDLEIIIVSSNSMSSAVKNSRIKEAKNYIK